MIIGSTAMKFWFPETRTPKDLDIISDVPMMTADEQHYWVPSFEMAKKFSSNSIYADPNILYTIKCSHLGWDIHWHKNASDVLLLKSKGAVLHYELYHALFKDWINVHGRKWATLKGKDSKTFFEDAVKRKYVHDDIHNAIAVYDRPLYERLLGDGVMCSADKFNALSDDDKALLVKEEVWVTALERYLIPNNFKYSTGLAYYNSLKKLITTMSGDGYFKHWMIHNYHLLNNDTSKDYITKFKQAEQDGKLRLVENK